MSISFPTPSSNWVYSDHSCWGLLCNHNIHRLYQSIDYIKVLMISKTLSKHMDDYVSSVVSSTPCRFWSSKHFWLTFETETLLTHCYNITKSEHFEEMTDNGRISFADERKSKIIIRIIMCIWWDTYYQMEMFIMRTFFKFLNLLILVSLKNI